MPEFDPEKSPELFEKQNQIVDQNHKYFDKNEWTKKILRILKKEYKRGEYRVIDDLVTNFRKAFKRLADRRSVEIAEKKLGYLTETEEVRSEELAKFKMNENGFWLEKK